MKKVLIPFLLVIWIAVSGVAVAYLTTSKNNNSNNNLEEVPIEQEESFSDKIKKIAYYKEENASRYNAFKEKNPTYTDEDVVTYVNIGLDQDYYTNTKEATKLNQVDILVNKYEYLGMSYVPDNLEEIPDQYSKGGIYLVQEANEAFMRLVDQARKEGYQIRAISAYRGYDYQKRLYEQYVLTDGQESADTYSARPGFSEHQTGLTVDIDNYETSYTNFETTNEFRWMQENAADFGFILRYPKGKENITGYQYESWHYRYVGVELAKKIKNSNLTFDEYYVRYLDEV